MPYASRIVSQPVAVHADVVYDYAHIIENLPQWASGLAAGVQQRDGVWYTESPMGHVRLDMAPKNAFRVLDHDVTLPDGTVVHNALRVTPAGDGSLLSFVVLRLPGTTDEAFEQDVAHVQRDLQALASLLESRG
ncbi:MAG: SRPBCC family protein [Aquabacterium sp.]|jgi:hypothetical protein|nr:MAG: SRPBCC family protein [Aquabacterium sp.]